MEASSSACRAPRRQLRATVATTAQRVKKNVNVVPNVVTTAFKTATATTVTNATAGCALPVLGSTTKVQSVNTAPLSFLIEQGRRTSRVQREVAFKNWRRVL